MTKLIEIKDRMIKFYGEYESYLFPVVKFVVALVTFMLINTSIGFRSQISTVPFAIILALVCSILPVNVTIWVSAILVLLDLSAFSMEATIVALGVFAVVYFLYFRFAPKDGIVALLTPICFKFNIPYVVPVGCGLMRNLYSIVAMICGTIIYYLLDGIHSSSATLLETTSGENFEATSKINVTIGQLLGNYDMYLVIAVFTLTASCVYIIRKINMDHAWTLAIVTGVLIDVIGLFVGYTLIGATDKTLVLLVGNIIALIVGFIMEFFFMNLDYARTERLQFEDDEYFYYVKAIPKKMVASEEKTVKHFGNTASMGRRIDRSNLNTTNVDEDASRKVMARDLSMQDEWNK